MPRTPASQVDPVFAEIAKAIYGDVDPREVAELSKATPDGSSLHVDQDVNRQKRAQVEALTGLGATGVAGVAGIDAFRTAARDNRRRLAVAQGLHVEPDKPGKIARAITRVPGMNPKRAAVAVGAGLLGLHGVELIGDSLGAKAQLKALNDTKKQPDGTAPVTKAFRLRPLNPMGARVPSLRAKRPKVNPLPHSPDSGGSLYRPLGKAWFGTARRIVRNADDAAQRIGPILDEAKKATGHATNAAADAAATARKVRSLVPSRKQAAVIGGTALAGVGAAAGTGTYVGNRLSSKQARRDEARQRYTAQATQGGLAVYPYKVGKSVTWTGEIAKVDADKRQVFGWASVSEINGQPVLDLQGDIVPIDEMEKSAYRYVLESRKGGDMHARVAKAFDEPMHTADMIESFVVTPEKLSAMGLDEHALPHGWWIGFHVNDDNQWNLVKSGQRTGFSIHGSGKRTSHPDFVSKDFDDVKDKTRKVVRRTKSQVSEGLHQAAHPPAVKLVPVRSSMAGKVGYQPQTRRLVYEMGANPKRTYTYRAKPSIGEAAVTAQSPGGYYNANVKGKVKATDKVSPIGRLRLLVHPDVNKALAPKPPTSAATPSAAGSPSAPAAGGSPAPAAKKLTLKPLAPAVPPVPLPGASTLKPAGAPPAGSPAPAAPMAKPAAAPAMGKPAAKAPLTKGARIPPKWTASGIAGAGAAGPRLPRRPRTAEQIAQGKKDRADREAQRLWIKRFKG